MSDSRVYLDYAATAPLGDEAARALQPFLCPGPDNLPAGSNANSLYTEGRTAFGLLEKARADIARSIGAARADEVIFCSGATEADNAALTGISRAVVERRQQTGDAVQHPHIITSAVEHEAVLVCLRALQARGFEVTELPVDAAGRISVDDFRAAIRPDTVLASIMYANNETGTVQPVAECAAIAHEAGFPFHTDAVQALGKIPVDMGSLGVDAASFSAHKIGGPKGVGVLYLASGVPFQPIVFGGGQERGLRSGTQNVAGAVAFAAAAAHACDDEVLARQMQTLSAWRDRLYDGLCSVERIRPAIERRGDFLPNIVDVTVEGFESETLILRYDLLGFCVSGGSACSSHDLAPSHVLRAVGLSADRALGSLRVSMGRYTTEDDIERFLAATERVLDWEKGR